MRSRIAIGCTLVLVGWHGGTATGGSGETVLYTLGEGSSYAYGCFGEPDVEPQCACPVALAPGFSGTFGLTEIPSGDPLLDLFEISNIDWTVTVSEETLITGSGLYEIGANPDGTPYQAMTLELFFDGEGPLLFESGLVDGGDEEFPPEIAIPIGDGFGCPGVRITVAATASKPGSNPADVAPPGGDGLVNVQDLVAVIVAWGAIGATPFDIDGSGQVDIGDLLAVVLAWTD